jgi:hypothetical protein
LNGGNVTLNKWGQERLVQSLEGFMHGMRRATALHCAGCTEKRAHIIMFML